MPQTNESRQSWYSLFPTHTCQMKKIEEKENMLLMFYLFPLHVRYQVGCWGEECVELDNDKTAARKSLVYIKNVYIGGVLSGF